MDIDANNGACFGAAHSRERHWSGADIAEPAAESGTIRPPMRPDAIATRHQSTGDRIRDALYPIGPGNDRSNDRARWWTTSRVGTTAATTPDRIGAPHHAERGGGW